MLIDSWHNDSLLALILLNLNWSSWVVETGETGEPGAGGHGSVYTRRT